MVEPALYRGIKPQPNKYSVYDVIDGIPDLDIAHTTPESMRTTVATWGSSKKTPQILGDMASSRLIIKDVVQSGLNIVSGCGSNGLMGTFLYTADKFSRRDSAGRPIQNLVLIKDPPYGDEDVKVCVPIGKAPTEEARIAKFMRVADNVIVQKGSTATLKEAVLAIGQGKNMVLVGKKFFAGLARQFDSLFRGGFTEVPAEDLFCRVDAKARKKIIEVLHQPLNSKSKLAPKADDSPRIKSTEHFHVVHEGGVETIREAVSLVQHNDYLSGTKPKIIIFVGDFFEGLKTQYQAVFNAGLLRHKPEELVQFISVNEAKRLTTLL